MKTVVLQSFRTTDVPDWISRCLASVRSWAARSGYEYEFTDDSIFALCGAEYLARAENNPRTITNLARLELAKARLSAGYDRAIWLDADVFVFAPDRLKINLRSGYAFGLEVWVSVQADGEILRRRTVHNAAFVFTKDQVDLDFFISTIRHVVMTRKITSNRQVGVWLVSGLVQPFAFPVLTQIGMLGPHMLQAIVEDRSLLLKAFAELTLTGVFAANLCLSLQDQSGLTLLQSAMDRLEATGGEIINRYVADRASG
jgi:hypothetical protein